MNPHGLASTRPSTLRVCQFHHPRIYHLLIRQLQLTNHPPLQGHPAGRGNSPERIGIRLSARDAIGETLVSPWGEFCPVRYRLHQANFCTLTTLVKVQKQNSTERVCQFHHPRIYRRSSLVTRKLCNELFYTIILLFQHYFLFFLPFAAFSIFPQVSLRETMRLNTVFPSDESLVSTQK